MKEHNNDIVPILRDTGLSSEKIERIYTLLTSGEEKLAWNVLQQWRTMLLSQIHADQQKIDRLDYFLRNFNI